MNTFWLGKAPESFGLGPVYGAIVVAVKDKYIGFIQNMGRMINRGN